MEKYIKFGDRWSKLSGGRQKLLETVTHLILSVEDSAQTIVSLLMEGCQNENPLIRNVMMEIIGNYVLLQIVLLQMLGGGAEGVTSKTQIEN